MGHKVLGGSMELRDKLAQFQYPAGAGTSESVTTRVREGTVLTFLNFYCSKGLLQPVLDLSHLMGSQGGL